ncbi:MAG: phosphoglucomutase/phosphomannomutase family protein [Halapricum sp.]
MGTDADAIEFGTDGWRATLDVFTKPRVRMVGQAVATYLDGAGPVAVGYDARETSRGFAEEIARTLASNGIEVLLSERDCPTPVVGWAVRDRDLAGALMITASHNPPNYNGVKFIPDEGAPAMPDVTDRLEELLAEPDPVPESEYGAITETDFVEPYLEHALEFVETDLSGLTVAYDAMHGSGRDVTGDLLERAGADVIELRCERDPEFGGTPPEPEADRLHDLIETVTEGEADLGIANDGDADRISVVTPESGFLDPTLQYAVLYSYLLEDGSGPAVRTVSTSSIIDKVARAHGQEVVETAVGFKWVAQAMKDHDALMGGEESGGFGITSHLRNKDGVLIALLGAGAEADRPIDDRIAAIHDEHGHVFQDRISIACPDARKEPVLDELDGALPDEVAGATVASVNTVDGFKIAFDDDTWLLVRPSGTEPKLRVYAEADSPERVEELLDSGRDLVEPLV